MSMTEAQRAKQVRERRKQERDRMVSALHAIVTKLDGSDKPLANDLRQIATDALA